MKLLKNITPLEEDFSQWYIDVITQGNLIEYGPARGSIIYKPNSFGIWEIIQKILNKKFNALEVQNVYLPLLIPQSYIEKEKDHVEGFAPELATVTKVGDKDLTENYFIRPTSEVLFGELFSKTIDSYNDLPIKYNQWANVIRWEKKTNPFLRTTEFLWQEGHTVHATKEEAEEFSIKIINTYIEFCKEYLSIPVISGQKTESEKFAGAEITYTIEAMMKDGKALQSGTSHYLGTNFSKPFNIQFKDTNNQRHFGEQTSWGVSTRLLGAIIMTHGDNRGIIVPPKVAPIQVDIIELFAKKDERVAKASAEIKNKLSGFRTRIDNSNKGPGYKAGQSEIQGVPLRIEIGPRDLDENKIMLVRRDNQEKIMIDIKDVESKVKTILDDIQNSLYNSALERQENNIVTVDNYDDLKKNIKEGKMVLAPFDGIESDENKIQDETFATPRCIPFEKQSKINQKCIITNKETKKIVLFARAY